MFEAREIFHNQRFARASKQAKAKKKQMNTMQRKQKEKSKWESRNKEKQSRFKDVKLNCRRTLWKWLWKLCPPFFLSPSKVLPVSVRFFFSWMHWVAVWRENQFLDFFFLLTLFFSNALNKLFIKNHSKFLEANYIKRSNLKLFFHINDQNF